MASGIHQIPTPEGSNGGRLRFDSVGDAIWNNSGNPGPPGTGGGVDVRAAWRTSPLAGTSSDNHIRLQFIGARFIQGSGTENRAGTARRDLTVFGALGTGGNFPGSSNVVELRNCSFASRSATEVRIPSC